MGNATKGCVARLLKTEDGLFRFLMGFAYKELFQTAGDSLVRITGKILRE